MVRYETNHKEDSSWQTGYAISEAGLTDEQVREMYRYMVLARFVDERMWLLNRAGKIPFVISCQGQEAAQAGMGFALRPGVDYIAPYYRDLCLVLIYGHTAKTELLSAFGKPEDPNSGGRQMPGHFGDRTPSHPERLQPSWHTDSACGRHGAGSKDSR